MDIYKIGKWVYNIKAEFYKEPTDTSAHGNINLMISTPFPGQRLLFFFRCISALGQNALFLFRGGGSQKRTNGKEIVNFPCSCGNHMKSML